MKGVISQADILQIAVVIRWIIFLLFCYVFRQKLGSFFLVRRVKTPHFFAALQKQLGKRILVPGASLFHFNKNWEEKKMNYNEIRRLFEL